MYTHTQNNNNNNSIDEALVCTMFKDNNIFECRNDSRDCLLILQQMKIIEYKMFQTSMLELMDSAFYIFLFLLNKKNLLKTVKDETIYHAIRELF